MDKNYLVAANACRWKYRRINLRLRHSNNADKKFQQFKRFNFSNHPIRYNKKTTRVPVLSHQTTRVKTYHLSAKREGDEFFTEGGLVNKNSNEGGFLFIMNLKI